MKRPHPIPSLLSFCVLALMASLLTLTAQEEEDSESRDEKEEAVREEQKEESGEKRGSAMPGRADRNNSSVSESEDEDSLETLEEVRVREEVQRDPSDLIEDPLLLKTEEERKRELIRKHMDLAARVLNSWSIPILGTSLAQQAEEKEKQEKLEAFQNEQERDLEALKRIDKDYYQVRKKEYYDTLIQARDQWYDHSEQRHFSSDK